VVAGRIYTSYVVSNVKISIVSKCRRYSKIQYGSK